MPKSPKTSKRARKPTKKPTKVAKKKAKVPPLPTREELEKKAKEEEEARIQAEKEEVEKKEKEFVEAKERKKREKEELKKIRFQMPELIATQARIHIGLISSRMMQKEQEDWEDYLNPSGPPDPRNLPQINTYLATVDSDVSNENIPKVLELCKLFFEFFKILETSKIIDEKLKMIQFIKTSMDMEQLMKKKINAATHNLLLKAKEEAPHDGDFTRCETNSMISICIWANVSKNPRVRSIDFEERNVVIEINPFLNRLSCCIRVVFMVQDIVSQCIFTSKALSDFIMGLESVSTYSLASYQSSVSMSSTSKRSTYDPRILASAMGIDLDLAYKDKQKNYPKIFIHEAKQSRTRVRHDSDEEVDMRDAAEDEDEEEFNFNKYNLVTPPLEELTEEPEPQKYFDVHAYHTVGGVFQIELFKLPYQPKTVKNWTIQMIVNPIDVIPIPYNAENFKENKSTMDAKVIQNPLMVSFKLPSNVHFFSEPLLALFDSSQLKWGKSNFMHKVYNESIKLISFKILKFGTMAMMQDAHINMPFKSFFICPGQNINSAHLTIMGRFIEVEFVLKGDLFCLTKPNIPELSGFLNEFMPLCRLTRIMRQSGFNFFPGPISAKYLSIQPKKHGTIERLYQQLSIFGNQASFKSSTWNSVVNDERIVFQVNLDSKADDWSLFLASKRQARRLKMQENSEIFSDEPADGFQSNMYTLFLNYLDNEQKERIRNTSADFANAFCELLKATNPFVYAQSV